MKLKTFIIGLFFCSMVGSPSYAGWTKVVDFGSQFYVDFDRISKNNGYIYYWMVIDFPKGKTTYASQRSLNELDCNVPRRQREISGSFHNQTLGRGKAALESDEV